MIKVIVGSKGSGKTAQLVDDLNHEAMNDANKVVCIEKGNRLDRMLKYRIRLLDISEYPISGYRDLLSFIAGISAMDYDLTHIYIDSILKVSGDDSLVNLEAFLTDLERFAEKDAFHVMIILSADRESLPEGIRQYC